MQNFFPESQKNDTTEKIESSKRTNGFIIKNKLNTNSSSTNLCKFSSQNLRKMIQRRK